MDCSPPGSSVYGDSPGKNTGVGCHALLQGIFPTQGSNPRSPALQVDSLLSEPPGKPKNTGVGSLSLLQWIFPAQELNRGLLHCRWILYQLSYQGSPDKPRQHIKEQRHHFADKGLCSQNFCSSHVWMWELVHKEGWAPKNWCFWIAVLEKTLESSLDSKEIKPVNPKGNQPWIFIGRTDAELEAPMLCPPHAKSQLIWKDPHARKDWGQEEKWATEDEMVGWHRWFNGHEFEQTPGKSEGQGTLMCCSPWVTKSWKQLRIWTTAKN